MDEMIEVARASSWCGCDGDDVDEFSCDDIMVIKEYDSVLV